MANAPAQSGSPCCQKTSPNRFTIAGIPFRVILDPKLFEREGCIGKVSYAEQSITVDPTLAAKETTEVAYWHEIVHLIFHVIGREDLCDDDPLVDMIAHLLYQVINTSEGGHSTFDVFRKVK